MLKRSRSEETLDLDTGMPFSELHAESIFGYEQPGPEDADTDRHDLPADVADIGPDIESGDTTSWMHTTMGMHKACS